MNQVVSSARVRQSKQAQHSPWLLGSFLASIVLISTTLSKVIVVPVVSDYVGGTIFEIAGYVGGLTTLYAPWLPKMMAESAGVGTANLLHLGSPALVCLEAIAIAAVLLAALSLLFGVQHKRQVARIAGVIGFALALVVPVVMFAVAAFVNWQMANQLVAVNVLSVPLGPKIQVLAALTGAVSVLLATRQQA
jgi:hypothetical protein